MSILLDLNLVLLGCGAILLYCMGGAFYRLFLSPLARFPGPKLAAATLWYEFYYDVVKQGQYTFKIKELHERYGPIIRISPYELHVNDPKFYDVLYSRTSPRDKYKYYTDQFGTPESGFSSVSHQLHRVRRQALSPFFSTASISRLEPVISSLTEKLCSRIEGLKAVGEPANMRWVYMCFTTDVITSYAMNRSWNYLDSPDFAPMWCEIIKGTAESGVVMKQFPWLFSVIRSIPAWLLKLLAPPGMRLLLDFQEKMKRQIEEIMYERETNMQTKEVGNFRTVFHELLSSDLSEEDKSLSYLSQEGQVVVGAAADTTANTLAITTFHLLNSSNKLEKLRSELEAAMPDKYEPAKLVVVQTLPYLSAVIQEGLRISNSVSSRLQRVAPNEVLHFQEWEIPAGTPVGMTSVLMHHDESIFPDSHSFIPERWSEAPDAGRSLERYLVAFSKGSRQCLGINLAKAELFLAIATIFRRYDMELFDTDCERDVALKHEMFLPQPSRQSRGIRVVFK